MSEKKPLHEGYQPGKKGYQPTPTPTAPSEPKPQGGYQPTSHGDNPANPPSPPKEE